MTVRRREAVRQQWPRTDHINEGYYAMDNQPSFYQLDRQYHFSDAVGRQYTLAVENGQVFQNRRLQYAPHTQTDEPRRCKQNRYGDLVLYVKLPQRVEWFAEQDLGRPLPLRERLSGIEQATRLVSAFKAHPQRRTGTCTVQGLDEALCLQLLNPRLGEW